MVLIIGCTPLYIWQVCNTITTYLYRKMKRNITLLSVFLLFAFMQAMGQTTYTVTLYVTAVTGQDLEGTPVVLENVNTGLVYNRALDSDGTCTITRVLAGTHMLTITPRDLALYSSEIEVTDNMSLEIELVEEVRTPYALTASTSHDNKTGYNEVALMWNRETDYFFDDLRATMHSLSILLRGRVLMAITCLPLSFMVAILIAG